MTRGAPNPNPKPAQRSTSRGYNINDDDPILMYALNKAFGVKPGYRLLVVQPSIETVRVPIFDTSRKFDLSEEGWVDESGYDIRMRPVPNSDIRFGYDERENTIYISRGNKKTTP
jgi:hypothetical protein